MDIKIALAGNPNSGKTTLFNALTGSNQFVGNWPGVTVEKKEGRIKGHKDATLVDLPGIYSLSPYTLEEVVARSYLINQQPDAIINIVDGSNLERNLYLTTQLLELGIPVLVAVNMMDVVRKRGDTIDTEKLSSALGCEVAEISALKGQGIDQLVAKAVALANTKKSFSSVHTFQPKVEQALQSLQKLMPSSVPESEARWYAIKLFERDEKVLETTPLTEEMEQLISSVEQELDDDSESIITNERYLYIGTVTKSCLHKKQTGLTISDKIDRIVTNRFLALPIFAIVMFLVYYVSVTTVGTIATDWANDGVFGDGWHLFGIGGDEYGAASEEFGEASQIVNGFISFADEQGIDTEAVSAALDTESEDFDPAAAKDALSAFTAQFSSSDQATYTVTDEETLAEEEVSATGADLAQAAAVYDKYGYSEPDPYAYGIFVPGVPVLVEQGLDAINCDAQWLRGLILDGIVAGVGAVLGFVPQILILFIFLAFLEHCGYMARIAFIMDRIFRKFGLSGKSFIPILIGTGCGIPGIMASRTIENERDRRMTIMTTTFIPCGAKLPFIALVAGAIFGGAPWVAPAAYFMGMIAIICSGIILKKTKLFIGDPAPFVMELPAYHMPTLGNVLHSMWERGWSFIKKAGTIILLSTIIIWFFTYFGFVDGAFTMLTEDQIEHSILAAIGNAIAWIFSPLGWGNWQAAVASITGLVAKENIVGTLGILYGGSGSAYAGIAASFTAVTGFSFLAFNLLCAPCFAAMGAIKREMNSARWTTIAIAYQCLFAYAVGFVITQIGNLFVGGGISMLTCVAFLLILLFLYLLVRPAPVSRHNKLNNRMKASA